MSDIVVTVPKREWENWLMEGDLAGDPESGKEYYFNLGGSLPRIARGERLYIVAWGKLRGYAPITNLIIDSEKRGYRHTYRFSFVRRGKAVAVTIAEPIKGFRGYRYRWWDYSVEQPFPNWREI